MDEIDAEFGFRQFTIFDAINHIERVGKYKRIRPNSSGLSSRLRTHGYKVVGETTVRGTYGADEKVKVFQKIQKVAAW